MTVTVNFQWNQKKKVTTGKRAKKFAARTHNEKMLYFCDIKFVIINTNPYIRYSSFNLSSFLFLFYLFTHHRYYALFYAQEKFVTPHFWRSSRTRNKMSRDIVTLTCRLWQFSSASSWTTNLFSPQCPLHSCHYRQVQLR